MSVPGRERAGGEERHAGEAGMRGRDGGNKIREQERRREGGGDHLRHGGAQPLTPGLSCLFVFVICVRFKHVLKMQT